jgi:predicted RNase H-like HicB family nuclease
VKDYHINIFYSEEDGGYIADIPDLEAEIAKEVWLEAARAEGKSIPQPQYRPVIYQLAA